MGAITFNFFPTIAMPHIFLRSLFFALSLFVFGAAICRADEVLRRYYEEALNIILNCHVSHSENYAVIQSKFQNYGADKYQSYMFDKFRIPMVEDRYLGIPESMLDAPALYQYEQYLANSSQYKYWIWRHFAAESACANFGVLFKAIDNVLNEADPMVDTPRLAEHRGKIARAIDDAFVTAHNAFKKRLLLHAKKANDSLKKLDLAVKKIKEANQDIEEPKPKQRDLYIAWLDQDGNLLAVGKFHDIGATLIVKDLKGKEIAIKKRLWVENRKFLLNIAATADKDDTLPSRINRYTGE